MTFTYTRNKKIAGVKDTIPTRIMGSPLDCSQFIKDVTMLWIDKYKIFSCII